MRHHHLVHESEDCNVWRIEWPIGSGLDWHDHGDSNAQIIMLEGELTHWVVDKSVTDPAGYATEYHRREMYEESTNWVYSFHQHKVVNEGNRTAVSLHIYRPPLVMEYDEALEIG